MGDCLRVKGVYFFDEKIVLIFSASCISPFRRRSIHVRLRSISP